MQIYRPIIQLIIYNYPIRFNKIQIYLNTKINFKLDLIFITVLIKMKNTLIVIKHD